MEEETDAAALELLLEPPPPEEGMAAREGVEGRGANSVEQVTQNAKELARSMMRLRADEVAAEARGPRAACCCAALRCAAVCCQ